MSNYTVLGKKTFTSNINIDNGYTSNSIGDKISTMELYKFNNGAMQIEWIVNDGEIVTHIGIEYDEKIVTGYDGVFEIPAQACDLLSELGFDCTEVAPDNWKAPETKKATHTRFSIQHGHGSIAVGGNYSFETADQAITAATCFKENPKSDNKQMTDENAEYWKKQVFVIRKTITQTEDIATI